ncbi:MAG: hypothetical protein LBD86_02240, partial [Spirochaetaceae bacterium]|nr:hypothetical protein [Spirochaetaceae bacterium]
NLGKPPGSLEPLKIGRGYTDGGHAYYERFSSEALTATKRITRKTERKRPSLRAWRARSVRKGIRLSKKGRMRNIAVGLVINLWFLGSARLIL